MAISDSYDFSISKDNIITDALETIGVLGDGFALNSAHTTRAARGLNMIVQQFASQADFSPGDKAWARKRGYLIMQKNQVSYDLGPSGDHFTYSYGSTTLTADSAASDTTLDVTSDDGIADADTIGVIMDNGTIHWDTVNGTPSGDVVTITTGLAAAASDGARLFYYTSKAQRPQRILGCVRRDIDGIDSPMNRIINLHSYEAISDKDNEGTPVAFLEEPQVDHFTLKLDQAPSDLTDVIRVIHHRPLADFDASTDTPDFPKIWYMPLYLMLAKQQCGHYNRAWSKENQDLLMESLAIAKHEYAQDTVEFFEPDRVG